MYYKFVSDDFLILSHPAKESAEEIVLLTPGQPLPKTSRWWLAPPGGKGVEQRLLPGKLQERGRKHVKEAYSRLYLLPLSLFLPAIVSYS